MSPGDKELGLGVVNPRSDAIERPEEIERRVEEALRTVPAERIFLNPDCGFGTFAARPMNPPEVAARKLAAIAAAARGLRERYAEGPAVRPRAAASARAPGCGSQESRSAPRP